MRRWLFAAYAVLLLLSAALRPADSALAPGQEGVVLPDGVRVAAWRWPGQDPAALPVVLLHGSPGRGRDLAALAERLPPRHARASLDLPGFGGSSRWVPRYGAQDQAAWVLAWLDAVGWERVHLVTHSLGGAVALELGGLAPGRVASATQIGALGVVELELLGRHSLNHAVHGAQRLALQALREGLPHFGLLDRFPLNVPYARSFYDTDQRRMRPLLEAWQAPMLLVHGTEDSLVPLAAAREHARLVPQAELVELAGEDHFLVFGEPEALAARVGAFLARVEAGEAPARAQAAPERVQAASVPFDPRAVPGWSGLALWVSAGLLALATLVSEDLTCISAGLLVADGRLGFVAASLACFVGIFVGDLLLVLAGRTLGRAAVARAPLRWWVSPEALERASAWYTRYGARVIFTSRFTPGMRLPLYVAAGVLRTPVPRFTLYFALAGLVWTPLLVGLAVALGEPLLGLLERAEHGLAWALAAALGLVWAVRRITPLFTWRGRRLAVGWWRRQTRWEFWSGMWVYPFVVLGLLPELWRHGLGVIGAVNPGIPHGGFVGESKSDIYRALGGDAEPLLPRTALIPPTLPPAERVRQAQAAMARWGVGWPVILKPNAGQRGQGVVLARDAQTLERYLHATSNPTLVQEYVPGREYGVFYVRHPEEAHGTLFSITDKRPLSLLGDGRSTLEELILADERAVCQAPLHLSVHSQQLHRVPAPGEVVALVDVGTHARGCLFLDGRHLITEALTRAVDGLSQRFEGGFFLGRYDVRAADEDALRRGEFRVIELNGATSEPTHIYDPKTPWIEGVRTLTEQWRLAARIGAANRARGVRPSSLGALWRAYWDYQRELRGQPPTDRPLG